MNRRKLLQGMGAAALAGVGEAVAGKLDSRHAAARKAVTPGTCANSDVTDQEFADDLAILMLFMLAISQGKEDDCTALGELAFPGQGNPTVDEFKSRWGFDPSRAIQLVKQRTKFKLADIKKALAAVRSIYANAAAYTGPDCPHPMAIKTIVQTAITLKKPQTAQG